MKKYGPQLCFFSLIWAAAITLACGSPSRRIQSLTVNPTSADAQSYPGGRVPFVATGYYNTSPATVTPLQANWSVLSEQVLNGVETLLPTTEVSVDTNGVAQCAAGASGTYVLGAWVAYQSRVSCTVIRPFGDPCDSVLGTAQLTCP
jgi:hypothetical protein